MIAATTTISAILLAFAGQVCSAPSPVVGDVGTDAVLALPMDPAVQSFMPNWLVPVTPLKPTGQFGSIEAPTVQSNYDVLVAFDLPPRVPDKYNYCELWFHAPGPATPYTVGTDLLPGHYAVTGDALFRIRQISGHVDLSTSWLQRPAIIDNTEKQFTVEPGHAIRVDAIECGDAAQQGWEVGQVNGAVLSWFETLTPKVGFVLYRKAIATDA